MTKVKTIPSAEKAALVVRSKLSRAQKLATVKSATKKVKNLGKGGFRPQCSWIDASRTPPCNPGVQRIPRPL